MRIVVFGAGTVGTWIAEMLCQNRHSVTVVDNDPETVHRLNEELDVRALTGSAAESSVLFQADVIGADLCLAVTGVDEVNMIAASMAKAMGSRRAVARVYAPVFRDLSTFDYQRHFSIDRLLSLEHLTAMELARSIRNPGAIAMENFARGELEVQEIEVSESSKLIDQPLKDLGLPNKVRLGSISRDGKMWIAGASDKLQPLDRITLIGRREDIDKVKESFQQKAGPKVGVVIAGGGETGYHLARTLEASRFDVVVMDESSERCSYLATHLKRSTVIHADATRRAVLEEERVGSADVFVACTGDDENNIVTGVEASEIGAKTIMAVVQRPDYAQLVGKLGIDVAVSPRDVMAKQVLGFLNTGAVVSRSHLSGGNICIFEIDVVKDTPATEHVLANLQFPQQCLIAAVIRENFVKVPGADDHLRAGDTVVALIEDSVVDEALQLFSPLGR